MKLRNATQINSKKYFNFFYFFSKLQSLKAWMAMITTLRKIIEGELAMSP